MKKVVFLDTAETDLVNILTYIATNSGYVDIAENFIRQLRDACHKFAAIQGIIGKARPDLRTDIRSIPYKNYMIFFRYIDDQFQVINILEGHRDIEGYFADS